MINKKIFLALCLFACATLSSAGTTCVSSLVKGMVCVEIQNELSGTQGNYDVVFYIPGCYAQSWCSTLTIPSQQTVSTNLHGNPESESAGFSVVFPAGKTPTDIPWLANTCAFKYPAWPNGDKNINAVMNDSHSPYLSITVKRIPNASTGSATAGCEVKWINKNP